MTRQFGIIGFPLAHSFSPNYFNKKFAQEYIDASYKAYPIEQIEEWQFLLKKEPFLQGVNVTIPYKKEIIPLLDELTIEAKNIGAVNCIRINKEKTIGHNTDAFGFEESIKPLLKPHHKKALILGTGGASLAVQYVLRKLNIDYKLISRKAKDGVLNYHSLDENILQQYSIIINTTPLGMSPNVQDAPAIPYHYISEQHLLYDLIYNPEETKFLSLGRQQGATIKNGIEMLHLQAEESWRFWNS